MAFKESNTKYNPKPGQYRIFNSDITIVPEFHIDILKSQCQAHELLLMGVPYCNLNNTLKETYGLTEREHHFLMVYASGQKVRIDWVVNRMCKITFTDLVIPLPTNWGAVEEQSFWVDVSYLE